MLVCTDCHVPLSDFEPPTIASRGVTMKQAQRVQEYVVKYAQMLGSPGVPVVQVRDNLNAPWLGRTNGTTKNLGTTLVELQKRILDDPKTLERVIAHEMVHHVEFITLTPDQIATLRRGIRLPSHAERFLELAKQINDTVGDPKFVTVKSDESYVETQTRAYYVLITQGDSTMGAEGMYLFAHAIKLTPKVERYVDRVSKHGARLVRTTDRRWLRGPRIGSGGWAMPPGEEEQTHLRLMYWNDPPT